ncbi:hypothetical protein IMCC14465_14780 [alpha proteobacterium IMCC14465]|uniref:Lycopene cyclase n=1 Tax=alpha proteobacterium IMCC14465 TaxID=1220535 RepID=J9DXD9_9PROT|nr:hypothetical protein IMCC14465_14780 [alpha proteobacterium IMCC14465]
MSGRRIVKQRRRADVGIIGGGLAGLSLAYYLSQFHDLKILVIDDGMPKPDHIWGFWDNGSPHLALAREQALSQWWHWQVAAPGNAHVMRGEGYHYYAVSSASYMKALADKCARANVRFINGTVMKTSINEDYTRMLMKDEQIVTAHHVFDTVNYIAPYDCMKQHFLGQHIRVNKNSFNPGQIMLMDFRVPQQDGIHFMYLLPFSEKKAFIESTVFSQTQLEPEWYREQIAQYINRSLHLKNEQVTVLKEEVGVLPMSKVKSKQGEGCIPFGVAANAMRASSSYAFAQINRQAYDYARAETLLWGVPEAGADFFERWMDDVMLDVLTKNPELAPHLFSRMAQKVPADDFARFMNGRSGFVPKFRTINAMPAGPFLKTIVGI